MGYVFVACRKCRLKGGFPFYTPGKFKLFGSLSSVQATTLLVSMADRIAHTLRVLWQPIQTAVQSQFADSLVVDDRQPIYTFHDNDEGKWVVLSPKWELWRQLIVVRVSVLWILSSNLRS